MINLIKDIWHNPEISLWKGIASSAAFIRRNGLRRTQANLSLKDKEKANELVKQTMYADRWIANAEGLRFTAPPDRTQSNVDDAFANLRRSR